MAVQCEDVGCGGFRPSHLTLVNNHIVSRKKTKNEHLPRGPLHTVPHTRTCAGSVGKWRWMTGAALSGAAGSRGDNVSSQPPTWSTRKGVRTLLGWKLGAPYLHRGVKWLRTAVALKRSALRGNSETWWQLGGEDKQDEPMCLFHSGGLLRCILIFKLLRYHQVASPSWWGHAWEDPGGGGAPSLDVYFCPCRFSLGSPASSRGPKTCSYLQISRNCMWSA